MPFSFGQGTMTSGEPITVQCNVVHGDLPMTLRWMFHGRELSSQMGVTTFRLNPRVSLLSIDSVAAAHAGDYTCTAQNAAGSDNQTASLFVQGQQDSTDCYWFSSIFHQFNFDPFFFPCHHSPIFRGTQRSSVCQFKRDFQHQNRPFLCSNN